MYTLAQYTRAGAGAMIDKINLLAQKYNNT